MSKYPPRGLISKFHTNTVTPPLNIPAIAPALVTLFQNRENKIIGPKVAPNPAQAKDTTVKMTLFSSIAIIMAIIDMRIRVTLDIYSTCLSEASFFIIP